jgi:carbon monoxide dehydrogenase subunit G
MLTFKGERELNLPQEQVWEKLRDARFLVTCVPDVQSVSKSEQDLAVCRIRPAFSFIAGSLDLTIRIVEAVPHSRIRIEQSTKGIANSSTVESILAFAALPQGTRLDWSAKVIQLGGLLKAVPEGLLRGAAEKVITTGWTTVLNKLTAANGGSATR